MSTLAIRLDPHAVDVMFANEALHLVLADGREISAPLEWFPRLRDANDSQRGNWRLRRGYCRKYVNEKWLIADRVRVDRTDRKILSQKWALRRPFLLVSGLRFWKVRVVTNEERADYVRLAPSIYLKNRNSSHRAMVGWAKAVKPCPRG